MRIVFALIWLIGGNHENRIPVKVGEFEKYHQCVEQGKKLTSDSDWGYDKFKCVPTNTHW